MKPKVVINFILFQLAWFACVIGAAKAMPWLGVYVTVIILVWHVYTANQTKPELILLLIALCIGAVFDQLMVSFNLIDYASHGWDNQWVPVWILALWLGFATALNNSLRWMRKHTIVAILFGAIGGPLAYLGASKLGALTLQGTHSIIALSIGWAVINPLLLYVSARFDGFKEINT